MRYSFCLSLSILAILLLQKHITALHESAGTPALLYQSDFALQFLCIERSPMWLFLAVSGNREFFKKDYFLRSVMIFSAIFFGTS